MKSWRWLPVTCAALLAGWCGALAAGVRPNLTPSLPRGLWSLAEAPAELQRGDVVEFCLPHDVAVFAYDRGYLGHGLCGDGMMPLLKPVAAIPGDVVEIGEDGVRVNGIPVVPRGLTQDSQGRPLEPLAPGRYAVQPGDVWLLSGYERRSFDSRYYGAVPRSSVLRTATPLWTVE
ncbi:conjugative transfer signal peptidase TraF [Muricoccus vinaceus]|uniref:Conjugative transfer signal peptidase TraF n=1 Tax=Muricoccus vinaceus TaxID=424704 RepID=A0ABV6J073_9PROT